MKYNTVKELQAAMEALPHPEMDSPFGGTITMPYIMGINLDMVKAMIEFGLIDNNTLAGGGYSHITVSDMIKFMELYPEVPLYGYIDFKMGTFTIEGFDYKGRTTPKMRRDFIHWFHNATFLVADSSQLYFLTK